ncbi:KilA-N domain-containing protein [Halomonas alkalicola]|uniref:KilA-N domain-containing protein n=1 Tax=Halomonas alkalicola TaxID=1930622 RepID=A0ABY9H5P6_9GAMM|nr:KilA-N domain-containing protein [Halomonas alkalicola]WLI73615.1 KilA-N domain-containing protein [Halomonas alkalicola]
MTSYATSIVRFDYYGQLVLFNNNGWINATEAARNFGKRPNDWFGLSSTAEYIEALERRLGITRKSGNGLVEVWRGGR